MRGTCSQASVRLRAIARRTPRRGTTWPGAAAGGAAGGGASASRGDSGAGAAAASTSSRRIRPCGPLPRTAARSTPSSRASARVAGAASGRAGRPGSRAAPSPAGSGAGASATGGAASAAGASAAGAVAAAGAAPSTANTARTAPTASVSPSAAPRRSTTPVTGAGMVTIALSVWMSTRSWSSRTCVAHADPPGDDLGVGDPLADVGQAELRHASSAAADAGEHAVGRRHVGLLDRSRRIRRVRRRHAHDRRLQRPERLLLDGGHELGAEPGGQRRLVQDERAPAAGRRPRGSRPCRAGRGCAGPGRRTL